jgi:hypothetical protein
VDLEEVLYRHDGIEYYLNYILFNPIASTIQKWRTFKLLKWVLLLNRLVDLVKILYEGDDVEGDLDSILLNHIASTILKWWMFKLLYLCNF